MAYLLLVVPLLMLFGALPRRRVVGPAIVLGILGVGAAGFVSMHDGIAAMWVLEGLVAFLALANLLPERWLGMAQFGRLLGRKGALRGFVVSLTTLVLCTGVVECVVYALEAGGSVVIRPPVQVVMTTQKEDWRLASILEAQRLPDPVTFWRPAPQPPYNAQGFKGPVMAVPKPAGLLRVMCYGDSNTDGPADGGWAVYLGKALQDLMPGRAVEVVNAGVSGYSSYQGFRRFEREVDRYQPDMILVSYGWNDAPDAVDKPDREFQPPSAAVVAIQQALFVSRAYRYLLQCLREWQRDSGRAPKTVGPRVSIADYEANMRAFAGEARKRGIKIALMTRPHRETLEVLAKQTNWRKKVPAYNDALRSLAAKDGLPLIDVQAEAAPHPHLFIDECHFTMDGHRLAARRIAEQLVPLLHR